MEFAELQKELNKNKMVKIDTNGKIDIIKITEQTFGLKYFQKLLDMELITTITPKIENFKYGFIVPDNPHNYSENLTAFEFWKYLRLQIITYDFTSTYDWKNFLNPFFGNVIFVKFALFVNLFE